VVLSGDDLRKGVLYVYKTLTTTLLAVEPYKGEASVVVDSVSDGMGRREGLTTFGFERVEEAPAIDFDCHPIHPDYHYQT